MKPMQKTANLGKPMKDKKIEKERGQFAHNPHIGDTCDCEECQPVEQEKCNCDYWGEKGKSNIAGINPTCPIHGFKVEQDISDWEKDFDKEFINQTHWDISGIGDYLKLEADYKHLKSFIKDLLAREIVRHRGTKI